MKFIIVFRAIPLLIIQWKKWRKRPSLYLCIKFIDIVFVPWLTLSQFERQIILHFELNVHVDGIEPMSLFLIGNFPLNQFLIVTWVQGGLTHYTHTVYWSEESLSLSRSGITQCWAKCKCFRSQCQPTRRLSFCETRLTKLMKTPWVFSSSGECVSLRVWRSLIIFKARLIN